MGHCGFQRRGKHPWRTLGLRNRKTKRGSSSFLKSYRLAQGICAGKKGRTRKVSSWLKGSLGNKTYDGEQEAQAETATTLHPTEGQSFTVLGQPLFCACETSPIACGWVETDRQTFMAFLV